MLGIWLKHRLCKVAAGEASLSVSLKLLIEVCYATGQTGFYFRSTDTLLFIPGRYCYLGWQKGGKDGPSGEQKREGRVCSAWCCQLQLDAQ